MRVRLLVNYICSRCSGIMRKSVDQLIWCDNMKCGEFEVKYQEPGIEAKKVENDKGG